MSMGEWIAACLGVTGLVGTGIGWLYTVIANLRDNHMKHVQDSLNRIEEKLDNHLSWHLTRNNGR
jgi:hypothetical protein